MIWMVVSVYRNFVQATSFRLSRQSVYLRDADEMLRRGSILITGKVKLNYLSPRHLVSVLFNLKRICRALSDLFRPFCRIYAALGLAIGILAGEQLHATGIFTCTGERLAPNPSWMLLALLLLLIPTW